MVGGVEEELPVAGGMKGFQDDLTRHSTDVFTCRE
jgi:hypothetical protein